jgi:hypothetical protein
MSANPIVTLKYGVVTFIAAIVFGILEPVMLGFRVGGSSALMNSTIANIATYGWRGLGLLAIALIVLGAVGIIRTMDLF